MSSRHRTAPLFRSVVTTKHAVCRLTLSNFPHFLWDGCENYYKMLSDENCLKYLNIKADAKLKKNAADEYAQKVFAKAPLTGIGSDSWILMWNAAEKYSKDFAYKELNFPNVAENSRCVLCQQKFDAEGRDRLQSFENFVKGELQRLSAEAEQSLIQSTNSFPEIPTTESVTIQLDAAQVTDDILRSSVLDIVKALSQRKLLCLDAINADGIPKLPSITPLLNLVAFARTLSKQARSYDSDAKNQNRPQLEHQSKELSAQKWLNQQRKLIEAEISRLRMVFVLNEADRLTNTQGISKKKSIIAEELITKAYIGRFQNELKNLKAERLSVVLKKTRADTGRVYHRIFLKNAPEGYNPTDILSEGEFRIVSLAAFLADTEGRNSITPFVFDDPISSLDHVYEEATAQRLVKLSEKRQVIVFTHRLSLVSYIEKYAEKIKVEPHFICLSEYCCGEIIPVPIERQKTKTAINTLKNERLSVVKSAFKQGDDLYAREAKAVCSDIRKILERIVEKDFLNEVVQRFCQEVQTKGKIHNLAKIEESDCKFIDDYLTKYSRFEHSQSDEAPIPLPQPDEIDNDLNEISIFLESIQKRNK